MSSYEEKHEIMEPLVKGDDPENNDVLPPHEKSGLPTRLKALPNGTPLVFLCFIFPALCGFLFGYDIGITSVVWGMLKSDDNVDSKNTLVESLFTSGSLLGASIGSAIAYLVGDFFGRRRLLMVGCVFYALGSVVVAASIGKLTQYMLIAGHIIYGLGVAFAMHSAPLYIAETAPPQWRGVLVSLKELFIVGGIAAGNLLGLLLAYTKGDTYWRVLPSLGAVISLIAFGGMACLPATPRWLMLCAVNAKSTRSRHEFINEAREGLCKLQNRHPDEVGDDIHQIKDSVVSNVMGGGGWKDLLDAKRQLVVGVGLLILQQVTGQPTILYTINSIIMDALNLEDNLKTSLIISSGVTVFKMLATLICVFMVDSFGRRRLLLVGTFLMLLPLLSLGSIKQYELIVGSVNTTLNNIVVVSSLVVIVTAYQIGFGPVNWLIISEIFPLTVRSRAQGLAVFANFASNWVVTAVKKYMEDGLTGVHVTFWWVYAGMALFSIFFIFFLVPETKGKKIEEIQALFRKRAY